MRISSAVSAAAAVPCATLAAVRYLSRIAAYALWAPLGAVLAIVWTLRRMHRAADRIAIALARAIERLAARR